MRIKIDDKTTIAQYGDMEVTVKRVEEAEIGEASEPKQTTEGLAGIAFAKRADNEKGAKYHSNYVKDDGIMFGIAVTRSI